MALVNRLNTSITLKIINKTNPKVKDSINIQPGGRVNVPAGWIIDPNYAKEYAEITLDTTLPLWSSPKIVMTVQSPAGTPVLEQPIDEPASDPAEEIAVVEDVTSEEDTSVDPTL